MRLQWVMLAMVVWGRSLDQRIRAALEEPVVDFCCCEAADGMHVIHRSLHGCTQEMCQKDLAIGVTWSSWTGSSRDAAPEEDVKEMCKKRKAEEVQELNIVGM